jgi:hypothetical protein
LAGLFYFACAKPLRYKGCEKLRSKAEKCEKGLDKIRKAWYNGVKGKGKVQKES